MDKELISFIPEFNLFKDDELRRKTMGVWIKAMKAGKWTADDLLKIPFTLLIKDCRINFVEHTRSVVKMCIKMVEIMSEIYGEQIGINMDFLLSGALLHDIGKLMEFTKEGDEIVKSKEGEFIRHPFSGIGLCYDEGIPPQVMHIIAVHSKEGEGTRRSPEAIILHHADFVNFEILKDK